MAQFVGIMPAIMLQCVSFCNVIATRSCHTWCHLLLATCSREIEMQPGCFNGFTCAELKWLKAALAISFWPRVAVHLSPGATCLRHVQQHVQQQQFVESFAHVAQVHVTAANVAMSGPQTNVVPLIWHNINNTFAACPMLLL